jgi:hypothetical protein
MFATLLGPLPRPPVTGSATPEALLDACLDVQTRHGLEPLTDGGWPLAADDAVARWVTTAERAQGLVKAVITGPCSGGGTTAEVRAAIEALAEAGCRWIEVHEPSAVGIGDDTARRTRFAEAHRAITHGLPSDVHLSLAITGGSADAAGIDTILAGAYASLALDLVGGPDNWRLAAATPGVRGIVCGALGTGAASDDGPEVLLWAAGYAASLAGRGIDRVGLATAGSLAALSWDAAETRVRRLGEAARLAVASHEERLRAVDPRAVDLGSAARRRTGRRART